MTEALRAAFRLRCVLPVRYVPARRPAPRKVGGNPGGAQTAALHAKLLSLKAQGLSRKEIRIEAGVSHVTVRKHLGPMRGAR